MNGLKELLKHEEEKLQAVKLVVDNRLKNVPDGALRITSTRKSQIQYMHCTEQDKNGQFIKKENQELAFKLAQKSYDQKVQRLVERRIKQIKKLSDEYNDNEIEDIYDRLHPVRQKLVIPVEKPWEKRLAEWKDITYVGKEFSENIPVIYTKKGERVRSKSEKIIADTFYDLGIEYKYECPLNLKGVGTVYPDFTILRKRDGKEVYWEHDGRMDEPSYAEKAVRKINSYIANGYFPGDNLIVSFESSGNVLNDRIIKKMISKYIF